MRPSPIRPALVLVASLLLVSSCGGVGALRADRAGANPAGPVYDRDTQVAVLLADTIQTLQRLGGGSPAAQAEIVTSAQQAYERGGGGSAQLRYALVLATPGHAGRDAVRARQLLRELAAQPETLAPVERALSLFELAQLDRELGLLGDNERLQAAAGRSVDQERFVPLLCRRPIPETIGRAVWKRWQPGRAHPAVQHQRRRVVRHELLCACVVRGGEGTWRLGNGLGEPCSCRQHADRGTPAQTMNK
jgi:hypothetical protein